MALQRLDQRPVHVLRPADHAAAIQGNANLAAARRSVVVGEVPAIEWSFFDPGPPPRYRRVATVHRET